MIQHICDLCNQPFTPDPRSFDSTKDHSVLAQVPNGRTSTEFVVTIELGDASKQKDVCPNCVASVLVRAAEALKDKGPTT
jgi:hypothetical protein